jgi:integrase
MATAAGVLPDVPEQYVDVRWICPQIEMLNPKDETQNMIAQVRAGLVSRSEMVARSGIEAASNPWYISLFLEMAVGLGTRRGEVLVLRWSDIQCFGRR